jgi:hypothetical protein
MLGGVRSLCAVCENFVTPFHDLWQYQEAARGAHTAVAVDILLVPAWWLVLSYPHSSL